MIIITWNANRADRHTLLWSEPRVADLAWDIICLQEAGKPDPNWAPVGAAKPWVDKADQTVVRRYTYTPPGYGATFHIVHFQWMNQQKNHLVIITKNMASSVCDLSGDMSIRPAGAIPVRLTWAPGGPAAMDVLIGTVHMIASGWAKHEIEQILNTANAMCVVKNMAGFLLVGDFNCNPLVVGTIPGLTGKAPGFPTHKGTLHHPLDYLVASPATILQCGGEVWTRGTISSDHWLVKYQNNGANLQIL